MLCPECRRIGRQCFQCRTYREEREQSIQRTNEAVQRLTRRVEQLESTQKATEYESWSNADLVAAMEYTGQYSRQALADMRAEILRRMDGQA